MNKEGILDFVRQGEGQTIEFKEKLPKAADFAAVLVSFANTNDGRILLGVTDEKDIKGIAWDLKKEEWVSNVSANNCTPHVTPLIEKIEIDRKTVVVITILEGTDKPYKANHVIYVRQGSTTRPADRSAEIRLMQEGRHLAFEKLPVREALFEDLNLERVKNYLKVRTKGREIEEEGEIKRLLLNLDFLTNGLEKLVPTKAGILCFAALPQKFIPQSAVKCAFFKGKDKTALILDRARLEGTLTDLIEEGQRFVNRNMKVARIQDEKEKHDVPEYPIKAVREALANAITHRDYTFEGQEVALLMFEDRLEIESPGGLPGNLTPKDLGKRRYSRNSILTRFLYEMGLVEGLGIGIQLIRDEMATNGNLPPKFEIDKNSFKIILKARKF